MEEVSFFKENGFEVTGYDGLNKVRGVDISNTAVFTIYRLVKRNIEAVRKADAVYIACTALATYEASTYLHEDLGIPVVTENAVAMLGALNKIGVKFSSQVSAFAPGDHRSPSLETHHCIECNN